MKTTRLDTSPYPRTYPVSSGVKIFLVVVGSILLIGGMLGVWYFGSGHEVTSSREQVSMVLLSLFFFLFGSYFVVMTLTFRVVVRPDSIEMRYWPFSKAMAREEIAGTRKEQTEYVSSLVLVPRQSHRKKLKLAMLFEPDAAFQAWFSGIPDLDAQDLAQWQSEIEAALSSAASPSIDLQDRLRQAKKMATILNGIGIAAAVWGFGFPHPYRITIVALATVPLLVIALMMQSKGIYQIEGRRNDPRPSLTMAFLTAGLTLSARAFGDFNLLEPKAVLLPALVAGVALMLVIIRAEPKILSSKWPAIAIFLVSAIYMSGAIVEADVLLDRSAPQVFPTVVLGQRVVTGKYANYYIRIDKWGPHNRPGEVEVGRSFYNAVKPGQTICAVLRTGSLHLPWYFVWRCSRPSIPSTT